MMKSNPKINVKPGDRFYSNFFRSYGIVTRYVNDDEWYFKLEEKTIFGRIKLSSELRAKAKPSELKWIKE